VRPLSRAVLVLLLLASSSALAQQPLDLANSAARPVLVEIETSAALDVVGVQFSDPLPASFSVVANVGRVVIDSATYEAFLLEGTSGAQITASDFVVEIDLATLETVNNPASSGTVILAHAGYAFTRTLDTQRVAGFANGGPAGPLHCSSQQEIDDLCLIVPDYCGVLCVIVPGAPYDSATGKVNLVGFENQDGCGETGCLDIDMFSDAGDLRLTEVPPIVPALPGAAWLLLAVSLILTWRLALLPVPMQRPGGGRERR
jgi:hypothetical protein